METVEILHYKWCISQKAAFNDDYIYIKTVNLNELLIYCKVERWRLYNNVEGVISKTDSAGIRTVPVKREEMERI